MTASTHRSGGLSVGLVTGTTCAALYSQTNSTFSLFLLGACCVGSVFGSLLPDIDTPTSSFSIKHPLLSFPIRVFQFTVRLLSKKYKENQKLQHIRKLSGHRQFFHTIKVWLKPFLISLITALFSAILPVTPLWFKVGSMVILSSFGGIYSHLLLDAISGGVPVGLGDEKRLILGKIKVGSFKEDLVRWSITILNLVGLYVFFQLFL